MLGKYVASVHSQQRNMNCLLSITISEKLYYLEKNIGFSDSLRIMSGLARFQKLTIPNIHK